MRSLIARFILPEEWAEDVERRRATGVPGEEEFATKPALARRLVERVLAARARPAWVVADAVRFPRFEITPASSARMSTGQKSANWSNST